MATTKENPVKSKLKDEPRKDAYHIDLNDIDIPADLNIRDMKSEVNSEEFIKLKALILKHGVLVPIQVKLNPEKDGTQTVGKRKYLLVDGGRRVAAVNMLKAEGHDFKTIMALKNKDISEEDALIKMFVTNEGKALNPIEKAEGVRRLIEVYGYKPKEVSEAIMETTATVSNLYKLCKMPKKIKNYITQDLITATLAIQLARKAKNESEFISMVESLIAELEGGAEIRPEIVLKDELPEGEADDNVEVPQKKKAKVTAKSASKFLGEKNTTKLLGNAYQALVDSDVKNEKVVFLERLLSVIKEKPTLEAVLELFQ